MGPLPLTIHAACTGFREIAHECSTLVSEMTDKTSPVSTRVVVEYPVFAAEILVVQLKHPSLASSLQLIKEHRAWSPPLVLSESTTLALESVLSHLDNTDVMYYDTVNTSFTSTSTVIVESDPLPIVANLKMTKTIATVVETTKANEAILKTKSKLGSIGSNRAIQLQLQEILKSPLFSFKHKFRSLSRTHFRTSSI